MRVATSGDALAPTAAATFAFLTKAKPSLHGFVMSGSSAVISCTVSAGTIQRVALVLDAIERALPTVGVRLIHDREAKRVVVEVGGERLGIGIAEETRRTETVIKHSKHAYLDERSYQYEFSGNLRLTIEANYSAARVGAMGRARSSRTSCAMSWSGWSRRHVQWSDCARSARHNG